MLQLPESIQDDLANNRLTAGHARALLGLDDENQQLFVRDAIVQQHLSVRQIEQIVGFVREHGTMPEDLIRSVHKRPQKKSGLVQQKVEPFFKDVQSKLADKLALKVRLQGSREKGKVVLNYSSEEAAAYPFAIFWYGLLRCTDLQAKATLHSMKSTEFTLLSKELLINGLATLASGRVLIIGDLMLDRYIFGTVERISPEAPVPVVRNRL